MGTITWGAAPSSITSKGETVPTRSTATTGWTLWTGGDGGDVIYGGAGSDSLRASYNPTDSASDTLYGEAGDDNLYVGESTDYWSDSEGSNSLYQTVSPYGSIYPVSGYGYGFTGSGGSSSGSGYISGGIYYSYSDGGLYVTGTSSNDYLYLSASSGLVTINGQSIGMSASSFYSLNLDAGEGDDYIGLSGMTSSDFTSFSYNTIVGGSGNDYLTGSPFNDYLRGGDGSDTLYGYEGNDYLEGGSGTDQLYGGSGSDTLLASSNATDSSSDSLYGEAGDDCLYVGESHDYWSDYEGSNTLYQTVSPYGSIYPVNGLGYGFTGTGGASSGSGYAGSIYYSFSDGGLYVSGTSSNDYLYLGASSGLVTINGTSIGMAASSLTWMNLYTNEGDDYVNLSGMSSSDFTSFGYDTVHGGEGNDTLIGNDLRNGLMGEGGNDTLVAMGHDDWLYGGTGADSMDGGSGNDFLQANDWGSGDGAADTLLGGSDNDWMIVDESLDYWMHESGSNTLQNGTNWPWQSMSVSGWGYGYSVGVDTYVNGMHVVFQSGQLTVTGTSGRNSSACAAFSAIACRAPDSARRIRPDPRSMRMSWCVIRYGFPDRAA